MADGSETDRRTRSVALYAEAFEVGRNRGGPEGWRRFSEQWQIDAWMAGWASGIRSIGGQVFFGASKVEAVAQALDAVDRERSGGTH